MSASLSIKIETQLKELERLFAAVEAFGQKDHWSPDVIFRVNLVLEELTINIIHYGHDEGIHEIDITLTSHPDALTIEIRDDGRPFDPLHDAPAPDVTSALEDRPVGGLGHYLVRTMMDDIHYQREGDRNHSTLTVYRKP